MLEGRSSSGLNTVKTSVANIYSHHVPESSVNHETSEHTQYLNEEIVKPTKALHPRRHKEHLKTEHGYYFEWPKVETEADAKNGLRDGRL